MNVQMKGINIGVYCSPGLKSAERRQQRQAQCDREVAFFEKQKENLKYIGGDSLEDISRKLDMLHSYEEQIAAIKSQFNMEEIYHVLDEAQEFGEKVAKEAEKSEPKTEKERREDMVEDALGLDEDKGEITEELEEMTELAEELSEELAEELEEQTTEQLEELKNPNSLEVPGDEGAVHAAKEAPDVTESAEAPGVVDAAEEVTDAAEVTEAQRKVDAAEEALNMAETTKAQSAMDALNKKLEEAMVRHQAAQYHSMDVRV